MKIALWLFTALISVRPALGFETYPEYTMLVPREARTIDGPGRTDSEYPSDVLTFSRTFRWDAERLSRRKYLDVNTGSISGKEFLTDTTLRLDQAIAERVDFRFTYIDQSDYDRRTEAAVLELVYWLNARSGLAVYGQPAFHKSENDVGLAYIFRPMPFHEIRLFYTWVDFSRNKRNRESDEFADAPFTAGFVARVGSPEGSGLGNFTEIAYRYEDKTRWRFPAEDREYRFARRYFSFKRRRRIDDDRFVNFGVQYTNRFESQDSLAAPGSAFANRADGDYWQILAQGEKWSGPTRSWGGIQYADRFWRTRSGGVRQQALSPHIWRERSWERGGRTDTVAAGYEVSFYEGAGPRALRANTDKNSAIEHRANAAYEFGLTGGGRLRLTLTFDLDRLFQEPWEGGLGTFSMPF